MEKKLKKNEEKIMLKIFKEEMIIKNNNKNTTKYHPKEYTFIFIISLI